MKYLAIFRPRFIANFTNAITARAAQKLRLQLNIINRNTQVF